ncbi:MAG: AP-1 complex subunit gamma-1 [Trebouxia sp. A1-2]|nr:MAG: AP-1 complex subunit gamma-1 [Trebouxia sp. A1-2]
MSSRLRELIRNVRQAKTAAEERNVIAKESAALRNAFKDQDVTYRHRNVSKLMYIHMLGYPTHFGQMETLKLIAASGFPEKRIGYLGLMILLDERQEVLMLVTNSLKNDLNTRNQYIVGLALCALGNICSNEMARDLAPEVEKLLASTNSYVRKKAALCATRVLRKVPEAIETFADKAAGLLTDRHHGVLLSGTTLMLEICEIEPNTIEQYRRHVPMLCKILRSLLMSGFAPEHDVGGITDPFLQVKVLRLLRVLGKGHADASDQMSDILAQVATNTEGARNAGNAILYECVQTIMGVESVGGLRTLAINILGRFLANRDNNIRYVALNTLAKVVGVDTQAVQRHRTTVVECVKDADVSIRRRALELVYALVNEGNIKTLTKELLDYLKVSDLEFKPDLTSKICMLVQRFAPDKQWHLDSLLQVMQQAGAYVKEEVCRALIVLISNAPELHGYTARAMYRALKDSADQAELPLSLVTSTCWFLGENGELLLGKADAPLQAGEQALSVSSQELVSLLESVLSKVTIGPVGREYALTALMKLSTRLPDHSEYIQGIVEQYRGSSILEVQARSCEYSHMFKLDGMRAALLEHIPPLDESTYTRNLGNSQVIDGAAAAQVVANGDIADAPASAGNLADLLSLDAPDDSAGPPASASSAVTALQDLLSGDLSSDVAAAGGKQAIADLLGGMGQMPASNPTNLADLLGGSAPSTSESTGGAFADLLSQPTPSSTPRFEPITAFEKDGIRVIFKLSKPAGQESVTDIEASYSNSSSEAITDFSLQAAVPKFMQLRLEPASSSTLAANSSDAVIQKLHVKNNMHGQKPLVMRLRIGFTSGGANKVEQAEVKNFPAGL